MPGSGAAAQRREIMVPAQRVLSHMLHPREERERDRRVRVIPASETPPPVFKTPFYLANIGRPDAPLLLELRFAETDHGFWIALLMTNERYPRDLTAMAEEILRRVEARQIEFDAVVAPESLGSKISQEIARMKGPFTYQTTFQKGKARADDAGMVTVGPPKAWIDAGSGVAVSSGTSHPAARQMLYMDPKIAQVLASLERGVLVVDDARLSSGTVYSSMALLQKKRIKIAAIVTVLNEHDPVDEIDGIPYIWLTKLPIFDRVGDGWQPREGSYRGLDCFYLEQA